MLLFSANLTNQINKFIKIILKNFNTEIDQIDWTLLCLSWNGLSRAVRTKCTLWKLGTAALKKMAVTSVIPQSSTRGSLTFNLYLIHFVEMMHGRYDADFSQISGQTFFNCFEEISAGYNFLQMNSDKTEIIVFDS